MKLKELKENRAEIVADMQKTLSVAESEERVLTAEEAKQFDDWSAEVEALNAEIKRQEKYFAIIGEQPKGGDGASATDQQPLSLGQVAQALAAGPGDPRFERLSASGGSEAVASDGGALLSKETEVDLLTRVFNTGQVASRVRRRQIGAMSNGLKLKTVNETSRADGSRMGGVQAFWSNEADQITSSKPTYRESDLSLTKLTALTYVTDELLQDVVALEGFLRDAFVEEITFKVEDAVFNGLGGGQPLGLVQSPSLVTVAKESGQAADTVVTENVVKMFARMWPRSQTNGVWFINQDVLPQIYTLTLGSGGAAVPLFLPAGGINGSPNNTLMGRPIVPVEYCATVGDLGDIVYADLDQYLLIDKGAPEAASSIHLRFDYNETAFRFVYRVQGQPMWHSALTPKNGSNTQSPFIALAARA